MSTKNHKAYLKHRQRAVNSMISCGKTLEQAVAEFCARSTIALPDKSKATPEEWVEAAEKTADKADADFAKAVDQGSTEIQ